MQARIPTKTRANTENKWCRKKQGAVVTCLAKGGPAQAEGGLRIGDTVEYVNALHVPSLLKHVRLGVGVGEGRGRGVIERQRESKEQGGRKKWGRK